MPNAFLVPVKPGEEACCSCENSFDPCTCCELGSTDSYSEYHGTNECPGVGEPCPSGTGSPTCAGFRIGPIDLYSEEFPTFCLRSKQPKASVAYSADNFGFVTGQSGQIGCPSSNECVICGESGVLTPFVETVSPTTSRLKLTAFAENAPHGGPYSLYVTANFYLE